MGPHHTLKTSYFNPESSGSFGGVERLRRVTGANRAEVKNFLQTQDTYTLHKPVRKKFQRRRVIAGGLNHQHQIDLVDVQNFKKDNDNISYLLTGIDVFSKYAYVVPLKNKSSGTLLEVFKKLFPQNKNNPLFIQTDLGTEFTNKKVQNYLKKVGIIFFTSHNQDIKASIIERKQIYINEENLIKHLNTRFEDNIFYYSPITRRVTINLSIDRSTLALSEELADILGGFTTSIEGPALIEGSKSFEFEKFKNIYVYCNIIEYRNVGDTKVPLLRVVPIVDKTQSVVYKIFEKPHYIPLTRHCFNTVEISLNTDTGKKPSFLPGNTVVTLHIRPQKYSLSV